MDVFQSGTAQLWGAYSVLKDSMKNGLIPGLRLRLFELLTLAALGVCTVGARADVAFLMEEPYGGFGSVNPTGHGALYFNHICAETPTRLRMCRAGEAGAVIGRYHNVAG